MHSQDLPTELHVYIPAFDGSDDREFLRGCLSDFPIPVKLMPADAWPASGYQGPVGQGQRGAGPGGLFIDLVLQHGGAVIDGIVAIGLWELFRRILAKFSERFLIVFLRMAPRQYRRSSVDPDDLPDP